MLFFSRFLVSLCFPLRSSGRLPQSGLNSSLAPFNQTWVPPSPPHSYQTWGSACPPFLWSSHGGIASLIHLDSSRTYRIIIWIPYSLLFIKLIPYTLTFYCLDGWDPSIPWTVKHGLAVIGVLRTFRTQPATRYTLSLILIESFRTYWSLYPTLVMKWIS